mmetsp:Transcript_26889/g.62449  ORF Transcript_26889/g.62449 Transcript_26889/m.62449 type:complete len:159 (+) Transcript_26889:31-507(+)
MKPTNLGFDMVFCLLLNYPDILTFVGSGRNRNKHVSSLLSNVNTQTVLRPQMKDSPSIHPKAQQSFGLRSSSSKALSCWEEILIVWIEYLEQRGSRSNRFPGAPPEHATFGSLVTHVCFGQSTTPQTEGQKACPHIHSWCKHFRDHDFFTALSSHLEF